MLQTVQTKKRIVQLETQCKYWQTQLEQKKADTAERVKKALATAKANDDKAAQRWQEIAKVRAKSKISQLKIALDARGSVKKRLGTPLSMLRRNKMLLVKFVDQQNEPNEPYVFHFKRIVDGKETVLAEREKERLRLYLAGLFD